MLADPKGLGKPPVFLGREEDFYVWAKKVENYVSGVFPNARGASSFAVESQNAVTATAAALGVPELEADMSTETDGQLFIVLSALTDGERFDVVMSAGGDHGFESTSTGIRTCTSAGIRLRKRYTYTCRYKYKHTKGNTFEIKIKSKSKKLEKQKKIKRKRENCKNKIKVKSESKKQKATIFFF